MMCMRVMLYRDISFLYDVPKEDQSLPKVEANDASGVRAEPHTQGQVSCPSSSHCRNNNNDDIDTKTV